MLPKIMNEKVVAPHFSALYLKSAATGLHRRS
jgi:hypothetical protein